MAAAEGNSIALLEAAKHGNVEEVKRLLSQGADVNYRDVEGKYNTPLIWAATGGHIDCLQALLEAGAEINAKNNWSDTALHRAVRFGCRKCAEALLRAGADASIRNHQEETAMETASEEIMEIFKTMKVK